MNSETGRTGRAKETHDRLIRVAGELFYSEGIRASGIEAVARQAGVTKMTLYAHFGSKDELVTAYLEDRERRWRESVGGAVLVRGLTPAEKILAVFDVYREWLTGGGLRGCGFINFAAEFPDTDHPGHEVVHGHKEGVRSLLGELAAEFGADVPEELGEHLFLLLEGAYVSAALERDEATLRRARSTAEMVLKGSVPRREVPDG
jgi:AcrR family transcriptional regulator